MYVMHLVDEDACDVLLEGKSVNEKSEPGEMTFPRFKKLFNCDDDESSMPRRAMLAVPYILL
jgi:hypothetical protein